VVRATQTRTIEGIIAARNPTEGTRMTWFNDSCSSSAAVPLTLVNTGDWANFHGGVELYFPF
jgi:hypothetical protein